MKYMNTYKNDIYYHRRVGQEQRKYYAKGSVLHSQF
jgi:hypothetical protein